MASILRTSLLMILLLGNLGALAQPAAAEAMRLRYQVWLGGAAVMELTFTVEADDAAYAVQLDGLLIGPPSWLYDITLSGTANGRYEAAEPKPERYRLALSDDGSMEWLQLDYDASGLPVFSADPPLRDEQREPLSDDDKRDTLDPLSALLALIRQSAVVRGACPEGAVVFDGRRRFAVTMLDQGASTLGPSFFNFYQGPARLCEAQLEPQGGFRRSGRDLKAFPRSLLLYVATPESLPWPVPVRIQTETDLGALIIHLVQGERL